MATLLRGAPITTRDVAFVYEISDENVARLRAALEALDATFRDDPRMLRPKTSHLLSAGHKLLQTSQGMLDVLGTSEEARTYADLLPHSSPLEVRGVPILVLSVERKLSRPKDRLMLLQLESLAEELQRGEH